MYQCFTSQVLQGKQGSEPLGQVKSRVHQNLSNCCHLLHTGHIATQADGQRYVRFTYVQTALKVPVPCYCLTSSLQLFLLFLFHIIIKVNHFGGYWQVIRHSSSVLRHHFWLCKFHQDIQFASNFPDTANETDTQE